MKCIAIDDEVPALNVLELYLNKVPLWELVGAFSDGVKALDFLHRNHIDLILLDINMPDISGLQLARSLPVRPAIIVTSAYDRYALESYEIDAVDYLLKPIEFERFLKALNKAYLKINSTLSPQISNVGAEGSERSYDDTIIVKSGMALHRVKVEEILYIEAMGNYVAIILPDEKIMTLQTMSQILDVLPPEEFLRVHKSYIVSVKHIDSLHRASVKIGSFEIPIGNTYREELLRHFQAK